MNPASKCQVKKYPAGEFLFKEKSPSGTIYIIKTGKVHVYKMGKNQTEIPLAIIGPGEFLGEVSVISDKPHSASAITLTDVECVEISKEAMEEQFKSAPSWLLALTRGLVHRLIRTNDLLRKNGYVDDSLQTTVDAIKKNAKAQAS